jgi:hypothetical protein
MVEQQWVARGSKTLNIEHRTLDAELGMFSREKPQRTQKRKKFMPADGAKCAAAANSTLLPILHFKELR